MTAPAALPDLDTLHPEALKALILAQYQTLAGQQEEILVQREQLHAKDEQLAWPGVKPRSSACSC